MKVLRRLTAWWRRGRVASPSPKGQTIAYLERVTADSQARLERLDALKDKRE